jgi:hypothetical protein
VQEYYLSSVAEAQSKRTTGSGAMTVFAQGAPKTWRCAKRSSTIAPKRARRASALVAGWYLVPWYQAGTVPGTRYGTVRSY